MWKQHVAKLWDAETLRKLFYVALVVLLLSYAYRLLFPPWIAFGSAQKGYYKMNRLTGETYFLVRTREYPTYVVEQSGEPGE